LTVFVIELDKREQFGYKFSVRIEEVSLVAFVVVEDSESIESALKRFKRKVQQEAIIKEIKKHSVYYKPGEKRRMKEIQARKRMRRRLRREKYFGY
jgi:small subunit ribosomal protein S21